MSTNYEAVALKNILTFYHQNYPQDYENILRKLQAARAAKGLGADAPAPADESVMGWLKDLGKTALTTVANYKLQSYATKQEADVAQQKIKAELQTQNLNAQLAAQNATNQIAQLRALSEAQSLQNAMSGDTAIIQKALLAVGALAGVWFLYRMAR